MSDSLKDLIELNNSVKDKLINLHLEKGFTVLKGTSEFVEELRSLDYKYVKFYVKLNDGKLMPLLIVPASYNKDTANIISMKLLFICNKLHDDGCYSVLPKLNEESFDKDVCTIENIIDTYFMACDKEYNGEKVYLMEPAHTINGARMLWDKNLIPVFGSHYYNTSNLVVS